MITKKMQSTESVLALCLVRTHNALSDLFLLKGGGLFISDRNQHGITFTMCLGKTDPFDVAGDP